MKLICVFALILTKASCAPPQGNKDVQPENKNQFVVLPLLKLLEGIQRTDRNFDTKSSEAKTIPNFNWNAPHVPRSIITQFFESMNTAYQELINRQQAFINLITCGNCVNDGWNAIMSSASNVPSLEWLFKPQPVQPSGASFFAATNQNGVVTGVGGSIVQNKPVVEFTFSNNGESSQPPLNKTSEI